MVNKSELTKDYYNPREIAKFLGVTTRTIFRWGEVGKIEYKTILSNGEVSKRIYSRKTVIDKLTEFGLLYEDTNLRSDVIYARVSTHKQKARGDLDRQVTMLKLYAIDKNPTNLNVITDVASGINDNRRGLTKLIELVQTGKVKRIFIAYKDRLTRFGFNYLKQICDFHNVEIVIVSSELNDKSLEIELAEDIISIIHSFSGKLYGLRKDLKQRLERELSNDEDPTD